MKGFRTIGIIASITVSVLAIPEVQALISEFPKASALIYGAVMMGLRAITTTPLFSKDQ